MAGCPTRGTAPGSTSSATASTRRLTRGAERTPRKLFPPGPTTRSVVERLSPAKQECRHEGVLLRGLDGQAGERQRRGQRDVVALGARGGGAAVRRVRGVHPHRGLDQARQLVIVGAILELDPEPVTDGARRTAVPAGQGHLAGRGRGGPLGGGRSGLGS